MKRIRICIKNAGSDKEQGTTTEGGMMVMARERDCSGSGGGFGQLAGPQIGKATAKSERLDVYELVTQRIIELLEQGTAPWNSPSIARVGLPRNFSTGKPYSGINVFLLASAQFQSPWFLTYLQAQERGGQVRKGEKGFPVVKLGTWRKSDAAGDTSTPADGAGDDGKVSPKLSYLKFYTVFNACQIDGIEFPEPPKYEAFTESAMADNARRIVEAMPNPPVIHEGRKAYPHYLPALDEVEMPSRETFRAEWRYYKTLFHELAHSTGHPKRLDRKTLTENRGMFAVGEEKKIYCQEELVAEMTAAFLGAHARIVEDDFQNSAAYLKGWMDVLRIADHKTWLVQAASAAQKAADYILGTVPAGVD